METTAYGASKLAKAIQRQIARNQNASAELILDFGEIQIDDSLLTNTFPKPIPNTDYLVCRSVRPGDRVLVAWVQNDAVVVDTVTLADKAGG